LDWTIRKPGASTTRQALVLNPQQQLEARHRGRDEGTRDKLNRSSKIIQPRTDCTGEVSSIAYSHPRTIGLSKYWFWLRDLLVYPRSVFLFVCLPLKFPRLFSAMHEDIPLKFGFYKDSYRSSLQIKLYFLYSAEIWYMVLARFALCSWLYYFTGWRCNMAEILLNSVKPNTIFINQFYRLRILYYLQYIQNVC
jgi:hypothetical protein